MWKVLVLLCLAASPTLSVSDRRCGTNANKLWLDVVFVIDNCKIGSMNLVYQTISSLFSKQLQIGTGYDDPRSTRVGFITYNWNATDVADFYKLQSWADLNSQIQRLQYTPQSSSPASRMDTGLNAAIGMIDATAGFRDNYKKIVIVFTSVHGSYKSNQPRDVSKILKSRGIPVVTVNTGSSSDTQAYLKQIASDNMSFAIADGNVTQEILKAMTDNLVNSDSTKPVNAFYNGLLNLNGNWYWDQPNDRSPIPLDPNSGAPPTRNACVADMKYSDGTTAWTPVSCANNFRFICEQVACDTDNYCDGV